MPAGLRYVIASAFTISRTKLTSPFFQRLYNDRSSYVLIGNSLGSILNLHGSDQSRDESTRAATVGDPQVAREANLLCLVSASSRKTPSSKS